MGLWNKDLCLDAAHRSHIKNRLITLMLLDATPEIPLEEQALVAGT